ncbi:hypothetical protein PT974_01971 [Cladobotryum mycophilum]|uniref:Rhodopsin domain-containing protein n=1 Tax=Cladobotryum mycophilum TaxID=491253 RepID=A0ABR0SX82_9HYPO
MPVIDGVVTVLPSPEGYVVDFAHPQRAGVPHAYWVAGVGFFLNVLFMGQRLYTKAVFVGKLQIDDAFLILAWVVCMATIVLCLHMFATGSGGVHGWEISIHKYDIYMMDVFLAAFIYIIGGSLAKVSLLIFYFRLSPQTWFMVAIWSTIVFITGYTVGIFFALIFACNPIAKSWDVRITGGECINRASLYIATAAVNIISDVIIFILPLPVIVRLQIPRRQKIGLLLIFVLGSLTIVTSIVRVTILPQMLTSLDQTWVISWASVWIIVEANLIIMCASLPTIRKFLKHVAPRLVGDSIASGSGNKGASGGSGNPPGFRTIGMISTSDTRKKRREYSRFDQEDNEDIPTDLENQQTESYSMTTLPPIEVTTKASSNSLATIIDGLWEDNRSDKTMVKGVGLRPNKRLKCP